MQCFACQRAYTAKQIAAHDAGRTVVCACGITYWRCLRCPTEYTPLNLNTGAVWGTFVGTSLDVTNNLALCRICRDVTRKRCGGCNELGMYIAQHTTRFPCDPAVNMTPVVGAFLCKKCVKNQQQKCSHCQAVAEPGTLLSVFAQATNGGGRSHEYLCKRSACQDALRECENCGALSVRCTGWRFNTARTKVLCVPCGTQRAWCSSCDNVMVGGGLLRCSACRPVKAYNDKTADTMGFFGTPDRHKSLCKSEPPLGPKTICRCGWDGLFYGIELEVETAPGSTFGVRDDIADRVLKLLDKKAVCKRDGSLSDGGERGFEIVTAPATLEYHKKLWKPFFDYAPTSGLVAQRTTTCGMHVHVSRPRLSWLQIGKIVQFIHEPENRQFIESISGRPAGHYQDYLREKRLYVPVSKPVEWIRNSALDPKLQGEIKYMTTKEPVTRQLYSPRRDARSRYTAVNLQNPHTVEFRLFKATLNPTTFFARLEFCDALVKYCAPGNASMQELFTACFGQWVAARRKDYPNLADFMAKTGFDVPHLKEPVLPPVPVKAPAPQALSNKQRKALRKRTE